ncbi:MAG TPA: protein kinase [Pirellulaceae bacterium]|nr:protein kinase [Pyrinomonadaceae bacterium]HMP65576.1 protein kinase [Pyrinomonadaceae bacterium]HMP70719.1 protein kinase [Pirellulaceae bacterium]
MNMFVTPIFSLQDVEMDVRERLVTPLIEKLGYTPEEVVRERKLILGSSTPVSADYVIETDPENELELPSSRILIETKRPEVPLSDEVLDQAVSYASHRKIDACHIILTNGLQLQIFEYVGTTPRKLVDIPVGYLRPNLPRIIELIGAEKIRKYFAGSDVLEQIGSGGFGRVFKSWQRHLHRIEALKVLNPSVEFRSSVTLRFERGAKGLASLKHPYICDVYEVGIYRRRPFYRMEYIDGVDVVGYIKKCDLSLEDRIELFLKICEGIEHAHAMQISHCDLKPANILIANGGVPKIIDFDLCHIGEKASTHVTQIGATIAYMDRTIWSNPANRDYLADIFSLGLVLWSIVTGKVLRTDWTPDDLRLGLIEANAEWLGQVIFRCLYLDRAHRPQNIEELRGLFRIADWRSPVDGLLAAAAGPLSPRDPKTAYELQFQLWKQNGGLPANSDFDFMRMGFADDPATQDEKEFIFRCACAHWRKPIRTIFKNWPTRDIIAAAKKVVSDKRLDPSQVGAVAESHPARKALDILVVTDEYRTKAESEMVARFYLDVLQGDRLKRMLHNVLDDMARLQCFKQGKSLLRKEATTVLIDLVRSRIPKADNGSRKHISKLLDKLSPVKCGDDSEAVAKLAREVARDPLLCKKAVQLLAVMRSPHATDALIEIVDEAKNQNIKTFEMILPWAVGIKGVELRKPVMEYLEEELDDLTSKFRDVVEGVLETARIHQDRRGGSST